MARGVWVVGYFEVSRRIVLTTPINPAIKRATRLSLAPSSPLPPRGHECGCYKENAESEKKQISERLHGAIHAALSALRCS